MPINKPLKVGIIGVGGIAQNHFEGYKAINADLVAISDINEETLKLRKSQWAADNTYTDYKALLANPEVEAVSICTPNAYHAPIAIDAAKAGKHILCEKPISMALDKAEEMIAVAKEHNVVLQIGHHLRSASGPQQAKRMLDAGVLGDVTYVRLRQAHDWGGDSKVRGVFGSKAHQGGGTMLDNGCHMMDLARYFAGDVAEIFAHVATLKFDGIDVEDTSHASLRFKSGALGSVENAWTATGWEEGFWIYGTEGSLEFTNRYGKPELLHSFRRSIGQGWDKTDRASYAFPSAGGHIQQIKHFEESIHNGSLVICSGKDGLEAIRLVLAGYDSAEKNVPVVLSK